MTTALSAGDLTAARASGHTLSAYLSVVPATTIATARVDQASFDRASAELTVDATSNWSNVKAGMTVWLGSTAGARDIGVFRVRKTPTADTLYIAHTSLGDPGLPSTRTLKPFGDNAYVTVIEDFNLWTVASRFTVAGETVTFYKDYELTYSDQNSTNPPCPLNIGPHVAGFVSGSTLEVSKTATIDSFLSQTISSVVWDIGDGTFTAGDANSTSFTATFPAGHHVITCQATLSTGIVVSAARHVFAHDTSTYPPLAVAEVSGDQRTVEGRRATLQLMEPVPSSSIPAGAMLVYWELPDWGGDDISSATRQFVGYASGVSTSIDAAGDVDQVEMTSAYLLLRDLIAYGQQLVAADTPAHWQECVSTLAHANFFAFYLLYWQTMLTWLFDIDLDSDLNSYTFPAWMTGLGSIPAQMETIYSRLNARLGQASDGTLYSRRDPSMMSQTDRDSVVERMTVTSADIVDASYRRLIRNTINRVDVKGFDTSGDPLWAMAPGQIGGQGANQPSLEGQLVSDQSELNERSANEFARLTNPYPQVSLRLRGNYDFFEPPWQLWIEVDLSDLDDWTEPDLQTFRGAVETVDKAVGTDGAAALTLVVRPETSGVLAPGETIPVPVSDDAPDYDTDGGFELDWGDLLDPDSWPIDYDLLWPDDGGVQGAALLAWSDEGIGYAYRKQAPSWTELYAPTGTVITAVMADETSPFLTTTPGEGKLGLYILEYDSGDDETDFIYCDDVFGSEGTPVYTTKQTLSGRYSVLRPERGGSGVVAVGYDVSGSGAAGEVTVDFSGSTGYQNYSITYGTESGGELLADDTWAPNTDRAEFVVTFDSEVTVYGISFKFYGEDFESIYGHRDLQVDIKCYDTSHDRVDDGSMSGDYEDPAAETWITVNRTPATGSVENVKTIEATMVVTLNSDTNLKIDDFSVTLEGAVVGTNVVYSDDRWDTTNVETAASGSNLGRGVDCDDHDQGVILVAVNSRLYCSTAYDGSFNLVSGADVGGTIHNCVRIPYYKLSAPATANDDPTALEFLFSTAEEITDGTTLWWGVLNASTATVTEGTDITPVIDDDIYLVVGGADSLETYGDDPRVIVAIAATGENSPVVIRSSDAGQSWSAGAEFDGDVVFHSGQQSFWLAGDDGLGLSTDGGATVTDSTTDFESNVDAVPILGVYPL